MNLSISFRHLESTPSLKERIEEKTTHLKKYFQAKIDVDWVCSVDNGVHKSEVNVYAGHHRYHASAEGDNLYKTFDDVINKIEKQLKKADSRVKDRRQKQSHLHFETNEYPEESQ